MQKNRFKRLLSFILLLLFQFWNALLNAQPNFDWLNNFTSSCFNTKLIACNESGASYVYTEFSGTVQVGNQFFDSSNGSGIISCQNNSGQVLWSSQLINVGVMDLKANNQNVYIAGIFSGTANIAGTVLYSAGQWDGFIAKLSSQGQIISTVLFSGNGFQSINGIDCDSQGNIFAVGAYNGTTCLNSDTITWGNSDNTVLFQLNPAGNIVWKTIMKNYTGSYLTASSTIDKIFVVGRAAVDTSDSLYFSNNNLVFPSPGYFGYFTLAFNASGAFQTKFIFGGTNHWHFEGVDQDGNGNLYLTDVFHYTGYRIQKYDPQLNFLWERYIPFSPGSHVYDMKTDSAGNIYTAGDFYDKICFPGDTLYHQLNAPETSFIAKHDSNGNYIWSMHNSSVNNGVRALDFNNNNEIFIVGLYLDSMSWNGYSFFTPGQCRTFTGKINSQLTTNKYENELEKLSSVFPNPSLGIFNLMPSADVVTVYNKLGQQVFKIESAEKIDLPFLEKGIYFLEWSSGKKIYHKKIILE